MAIRLATLAMVPVKRVCRFVNPVSNGDPLCANPRAGYRVNSVRSVMIWRVGRSHRNEARRRRVMDGKGAVIGTSNGPAGPCYVETLP